MTPHVAQNDKGRRSAIDRRTTRHPGYAVSIKIRAWIETHFGWIKSVANTRQVAFRALSICGSTITPSRNTLIVFVI